ncbi:MAG: cytochrome-c peroxidase [Sandaracinaceae bacterium]
MTRKNRDLASVLLSLALLVGCGEDTPAEEPTPTPAEEEPEAAPTPLREVVGEHFTTLEPAADIDRGKVMLGRALFHDRRLSGDETLSCATCHSLDHGGAEPRRVSTGIRGQQGPINSPTVLNAVHNFRQFWDGRAADLREQAAGPVTNPIEMGGDWEVILERLRGDEELVAQFTAAYGEDSVSQENIIDAIARYEEFLVTPAAFDRWLGGEDDALNEQQQRGLRTFVEMGCTTCHRGVNLGGDSYQRMGLVNNYFERRGGDVLEADLGRFNQTQEENDRHMFKVPTLRNIEQTSPYFHDGSEAELSGAVRTMGWAQLGRDLTDEQVGDIVAFLGALTGELPEDAALPGADEAPADDPSEDSAEDSAEGATAN